MTVNVGDSDRRRHVLTFVVAEGLKIRAQSLRVSTILAIVLERLVYDSRSLKPWN